MNQAGSRYRTVPEFIIGVTREIWEGRSVASLNHYYAPEMILRSPASVTVGNRAVIAATLATLSELPDRVLLGEDVIWSGGEQDGYLSSHRLFSTATHLCDGIYGPATGKRVAYRIIADCHVNPGLDRIDDEWLIRDQGAIVRQLGSSPEQYARDRIEREGGPEACARPFTPDDDLPGPYAGRGNDNVWGKRYAGVLERIMDADLSVIPEAYDRACQLEHPGGVSGHSHADADRFWLSLRSSFPTAAFSIDHRIGREDLMMPPRAAIRWSLTGEHAGPGAFGPPTGARVHVMGACHAEFGPWGIRREYVLYDETAVWKQILLGAQPARPRSRRKAGE